MDVMPPVQGPGLPGHQNPYVKREVDLAYSKEEAAVNDALLAHMNIPEEMLRSKGVAQYMPRHGFAKSEPGLYEVLGTGRTPGPDSRMDYSGSYGSFSGTSRPGLGML
jgi:hypothetical protein